MIKEYLKLKNKWLMAACLCLVCMSSFAMRTKTAELKKSLSIEAQARWQILEILNTETLLLKMDAIEAIALSRDENLLSNLVPIINSPKADDAIKFASLMAIGDARYAGGLDTAKKLISDEKPSIAMAASYALIRLGDTNIANYKTILKHLDSTNQADKDNAVMILGKAGDRRYINVLRWMIPQPSSTDRTKLMAIEALAELRDPDIYQKAWSLMISKRADDRLMGIISMQKLRTDDAKNAIMSMLEDGVLEVRLVAAGQLAKLGDNSGKMLIVEFFENTLQTLKSPDRERALIHAIDATINLKDVETAKYIPSFLEDNSLKVRLKAAQAILSI